MVSASIWLFHSNDSGLLRADCGYRSAFLLLIRCNRYAAAEGAAVAGGVGVEGGDEATVAAALGGLLLLSFGGLGFHEDHPSFFYLCYHIGRANAMENVAQEL